MQRITVLIFIITSAVAVHGQATVKTLQLPDSITNAFIDRPGDLYIQTTQGQLQKIDTEGHLISLFNNKNAPALFDPRDGSRLFAFYREAKRYEFLSPSFETVQSFTIDPAFAIEPWLVCASGDHNIWILDAADMSLKKINTTSATVLTEAPTAAILKSDKSNFTQLREYQGFVFVLDKSAGIHIFTGMGKYSRTIPVKNLAYFNFLGEELYYPAGGSLKFLDLFTAESRDVKQPQSVTFTLLTDERIYRIKGKRVDVLKAP
jgi:hypothetical protein